MSNRCKLLTLDDADDAAPVVSVGALGKAMAQNHSEKRPEPKKPRILCIKKTTPSPAKPQPEATSEGKRPRSEGQTTRADENPAPKKKPFVPYVDDPRLPEIVRVSLKTPVEFDVYVCGRYVPKNCDLNSVDPRIHAASSYPFSNPYFTEPEETGAPKYEEYLRRTHWKNALSDLAAIHLKNGRRLRLGCWCDPRYPPNQEGRWCHAKIVARLIYERKQIFEGSKAEAARHKALCVASPKTTWRLDDPKDASSLNQVQMSLLRNALKGDDAEYDEAFYERLAGRLAGLRSEGAHKTDELLTGEPLRILLTPFYERTCYAWLVHPYGKNPLADLDAKAMLERLKFASGPSREGSQRGAYLFEVSLLDRGPMKSPPMVVNFSYAEKAEAHERAKRINPHELPIEATSSDDFEVLFVDEHDSYVHECSASPASNDHASFMNFLEDLADAALETLDAERRSLIRNALIDGMGARFYASSAMGFEGSAQDFFEGSLVEFWFDLRVVVRKPGEGPLFFRPLLKITRAETLAETKPKSRALTLLFE